MEKKSIVEEALLSMKNLEEAVAENAKGILASTMKEEIKDLVKESLSEQEDEEETETEVDMEVGSDDEEESDMDTDMEMDMMPDDEESDMEDDEESDMEDDEEMEPIDLTGASDEEILKVFKAMGDEDGIIVKKDNNKLHLEDENANVEYMIDLGESLEESDLGMESYDDNKTDFNDVMDRIFNETDNFEESEDYFGESDVDALEGDEVYSESETDEVVYEIALDEEDEMPVEGEEFESMYEEDEMPVEGEEFESMYEEDEMPVEGIYDEAGESYDYTQSESMYESKMSIKPKGKVGKGPKFSYKKNAGGFKEDKKHANPTKGTGKPKFEYKEGKTKMEKAETKEAARTLGFGRRGPTGKHAGLRKGITPNRNLGENSIKQYEEQLRVLREKNEEYRKALNIFREKLNEVAVFNSNLAYATRLFTEHSTTKQEKINILRRFDGAESLKESKGLYRTIKEELGQNQKMPVTESISEKINRDPSSGSAQNLIESKTYENPQFMRMKDLMSKLIK